MRVEPRGRSYGCKIDGDALICLDQASHPLDYDVSAKGLNFFHHEHEPSAGNHRARVDGAGSEEGKAKTVTPTLWRKLLRSTLFRSASLTLDWRALPQERNDCWRKAEMSGSGDSDMSASLLL